MAFENQTILELVGLIDEQQELIATLLEVYPETEFKAAMIRSVNRTRVVLERIKINLGALPAGPDPDCPNCDGTGSALPGGACDVCWVWREHPEKWPDKGEM